MNTQMVVETLKKEADKDEAFKDVSHVFASRKRARRQVTVASLANRMAKEGFGHSRTDYARVLRRLADLGFGSLQKDAKGNIKALKDIRISLQSIGAAAVGEAQKLINARQRVKFSALSAPEAMSIAQGIADAVVRAAEDEEKEEDKKAIVVPQTAKRVILLKEGRAIELSTEDISLINEIFYGPERQGSA